MGYFMAGFVYMWVNKINSKKYIGSHIGTVEDGYIGSGKIFLQAIEKYGVDNFERIILEHVDDKEMVRDREQYYLDLFNAANDRSFYNLKSVAGGGFEYINNGPLCEQYKTKRVEQIKSWYQTNNHPRGMTGKRHTEEHRQKLKAYAAHKNEQTKRPVLQYDLEGNLVAEHESISHAARAVRGVPSNIKYTIEGKFSTAYKHKWMYKK